MAREFSAGIWEQSRGFVEWSRHSTLELARTRAVRYARDRRAPTGGSLSWAGGVRGPDGTVTWFDLEGRQVTSA